MKEPTSQPKNFTCPSCKKEMDVSTLGPFTNVQCPHCGEHSRVNCELGNYTLLRRHAYGGMSTVFLAHDNNLDRKVAVKVLSEKFSQNDSRVSAFETEARLTASISHPNVVRVFTTGHAYGRLYIAMEFVNGEHFENTIRTRKKVPEKEVLTLAQQIAKGLQAAKAGGLIHRDVKPGNILIDDKGNATLVDFGLALVAQGGKARAEEIWATPAYVAPEAIAGGDEDFRSDIYAFGASFYHALSGSPSCSTTTLHKVATLQEEKRTLKPLKKVAPWVSDATCAIIDRCMAYQPKDRYRSYRELLVDLENAEADLNANKHDGEAGSSSHRSHRLRNLRRLRKRKQIALGSGILTALLALVGTLSFLSKQKSSAGQIQQADQPEIALIATDSSADTSDAGAAHSQARQISPESKKSISELYQEAALALDRGQFSQATKLYAQIRERPDTLEPTASWAACEAIAAAFLEGDSAAAKLQINNAIQHISQTKNIDPSLQSILLRGLQPLTRLAGVNPSEIDPSNPNAALLLQWLAALKNWDQGLLNQAQPLLEIVAEKINEPAIAWIRPHAKWAQAYLDDLQLLRETEPQSFALSPSEAEDRISDLDGTMVSLKTQGRAQFNVKSWQRQLQYGAQRKMLEEEKKEREAAIAREQQPPELATLMRSGEISQALELLNEWDPTGEQTQKKRQGLIEICYNILDFLNYLARESAQLKKPIELPNGKEFNSKIEEGEVTLSLKDESGAIQIVKWQEISSQSVIALHKAVVRRVADREEQHRRHSQAIFYELLMGDQQQATAASETLSAASENFKKQWEALSPFIRELAGVIE